MTADAEEPEMIRYWFTFDLDGLGPEPTRPGAVTVDGGTFAFSYCGHGVGVTGYDEADCLSLIEAVLAREGEPLPPVNTVTRDFDVDTLESYLRPHVGVPVWRGVWLPKTSLWEGPATLS